MSLKRINTAIIQLDARCELVKGDGYHYLVWDDPFDVLSFETESIMVHATSHLSPATWLYEARQFIEKKTTKE
jgi:hypothetical protein